MMRQILDFFKAVHVNEGNMTNDMFKHLKMRDIELADLGNR